MCWAKRVGSQFLVAQPGSEVEAKKKRMTQKAILLKMRCEDGPEAAHRLPQIEAGHMQANGQGTAFSRVVIGNQGEAGGDVEGFAYAHQAS